MTISTDNDTRLKRKPCGQLANPIIRSGPGAQYKLVRFRHTTHSRSDSAVNFYSE
ncbi:hypothetical protein M758_9G004900 [Ceratodon purpureus]|uniref:Uncharacterized protein n=1 Tax=Ceratodon purpureus TaxID=3225 RepID=A0A8T0GQW5_CERPU|nr:hypothetical protein KC19_9G005300 [Ceratodon purpureus]KAG0604738.1 hypothetical protein M758_9G004900 [Ceratodon purpureus]